jgi:isopentenyl-diphosphate delta-isomerase
MDIQQLTDDITRNPEKFTVWFRTIMNNLDANEIQRWARLAVK